MADLVNCSCGVALRVPDRGVGVRIRCPRCKLLWDAAPGVPPIRVQEGPVAAPPPPAPPPPAVPAPPGTLGCTCGAFLRLPAGHDGVKLRCPRCKQVWDVPPPPKTYTSPEEEWAAAAVAASGDGWEVAEEVPPGPAPDDWVQTPYEAPRVGEGYKARRKERVARAPIRGAGEGDPYEKTEEEFQEELRAVRRRHSSGRAKLFKAAMLLGIAAVGFVAFLAVGYMFRGVEGQIQEAAATRPVAAARATRGIAQGAVVAVTVIVLLLYWLFSQVGTDD